MKALVEDLLLLARLDEGRPLAREPVELVGLAAEAMQTARAVGADWPVHLDAARPVETTGDRDRLRQVLDNLLVNVRTHTAAGTTTTIRLSRSDGQAVVEVADDGAGLDAEQAARVFERFYRADPSRSRAHGGAGLGLAIVKAIVTAHGGEVSAGAAPGGGALFTVRLPAA
jgi:two-component system OmpR family sensor kinase